MKIDEFRRAVETLNWNRRDLSGATRHEFVRMDVRVRLEKYIDAVEALIPSLHARFAADLATARFSIESARATVVQWEGYRAQIDAGTDVKSERNAPRG